MINRIYLYSLLSASIMLHACAVGPNYHAPEAQTVSIPDEWHGQLPHEGKTLQLIEWWHSFNDATLVKLIEISQQHSPTLEKALAVLQESRASAESSQASRFPQFSGRATATRTGGGGGFGLGGISGMNTTTTGTASTSNNSTNTGTGTSSFASTGLTTTPINMLTSALDASWEVDLFGKKERSIEGSRARMESNEANWHDAKTTLAAEVANSYVSLRSCEALLDFRHQEYQSRQQSYHLTQLKVNAGMAAPVDTTQAIASLEDSANILENQKGTCEQTLNQLVQLTGVNHKEVLVLLGKEHTPIPIPQTSSLHAVPAQLISQRPDVRAAERNLAAASADIGVAIAQRLPSLTLTGSIGINSFQIQDYSIRTKSWSFGPSLSLPVFDGGASAARVEAARARYQQALASYRTAVLKAVKEVEDALVRINTISRRKHHAAEAVHHNKILLDTLQKKYQAGNATLFNLEETRRLYLASAESQLSAQQEHASAWIALYKALGGGWQTAVPLATPAAQQPPESSPHSSNNQARS